MTLDDAKNIVAWCVIAYAVWRYFARPDPRVLYDVTGAPFHPLARGKSFIPYDRSLTRWDDLDVVQHKGPMP